MEQALLADDPVANSAMGKALWRIVPLILLAYLAAYIDRVNVSFAALQMNADLGFSATTYGFGGGLFFLSYALFAVPANVMLMRFGARRWIATIMVTWGLLSAATMFVRSPIGFFAIRFLLGVAEAGFYPGVIFYFSGWFPAKWRGRAISRFYVASPLASVVMGAVSGWLLSLDGHAGLRGWQWLFVVQGLPAVLMGLVLLRLLPDSPRTVAWLTAPERAWLDLQLQRDAALAGDASRHGLIDVIANPHVRWLCLIGFLMIGSITTLVLSAPLVLAAKSGLGQASIGYVVSAGGLFGAAVMLISGSIADKRDDRFGDVLVLTVAMAGAFLLIGLSAAPVPAIVGYMAFAGTCFAIPMLTSSGWADVVPARHLAVGAAVINTAAQIGAFVMPYIWGIVKDATGSFDAGLLGLSAIALILALATWRFRALVRSHHRARALELALV